MPSNKFLSEEALRAAPVQPPAEHPRTLGWVGTTALAMGGSNQSLFLLGALFIGQGDILGQGSMAVPLLALGLLLSWAALPGWTELVLMWPNRVGGIAATCGEAFRPYAPVLANLAGTCYWWGWVPTCGLTALLSASAIHQWYLPAVPVSVLAIGLVVLFTGINLCGVKWVARLVIPLATCSATLALLSGLVPIFTGEVDWQQATNFHLTTPFDGLFGQVTSLMAGLYIIGFAAPAFEAAACHVGETIDPNRNVPRAMFASAGMAGLYFILLPLVWLGVLGAEPLGKDLALELGPTFAAVFGASAKAAAIWFMMMNMFHGTVQPLAGAARTLSQLAEDGLLPEVFARRSVSDAPWVATLCTAGMAIFFLLIGDPIWLIAAANFAYLIGITLPSIAVWLLRRDDPDRVRPYRAPRGTVTLGLVAAGIWGSSAVLGFQQFGLPTVLFGIAFAYSGAALYALRKFQDRRKAGLPGLARSLHLKLTGAMLLVLLLDGIGYLLAVNSVPTGNSALVAALEDIFVAVAILTISVGLILPGMISHSATGVAAAADRLARGTVADFSRAMRALGAGRLADAHARADYTPVIINSQDELGEMGASFNVLQAEIANAAVGLDEAREGLQAARLAVDASNQALVLRVDELRVALERREKAEQEARLATQAAEAASRSKSQFLANMSHEIRTPIHAMLGMTELLLDTPLNVDQQQNLVTIRQSGKTLLSLVNDVLDLSRIEAGKLSIEAIDFDLKHLLNEVHATHQPAAIEKGLVFTLRPASDIPGLVHGDPLRLRQILNNLVANAIKFTPRGYVSLEVDCLPDDPETAALSVEFRVLDSGIGISEDTLARLFTAFEQADSSTTRLYGGSGLGLVISQDLVGLMGGSLQVSSALGLGSKFSFRLPFGRVQDAPLVAQTWYSTVKPANSQGLRALLAEDNHVNRIIAVAILHRLGWQVDAVNNGQEAVAQFQATPYDAVLMDCLMPEMDGFEAAARIRELESARRAQGLALTRVPIIAVTANALQFDRERCLAAGMDDYLSKPFSPEQLSEAIARCLAVDESPTTLLAPVQRHVAVEEPVVPAVSAVNLTHLESIRQLQSDAAPDIFNTVLQVFIEEGPLLLKTMRDAIEVKHFETLRRAAHALKSSSSNLGAMALATGCERVELLAREGQLSAAADHLGELEAEMARVAQALRTALKERPSGSAVS